LLSTLAAIRPQYSTLQPPVFHNASLEFAGQLARQLSISLNDAILSLIQNNLHKFVDSF